MEDGANETSLNAPTEVVKQIIINIEAGVEVEVTIAA
jgi:small subunit ribosomal protein S20e